MWKQKNPMKNVIPTGNRFFEMYKNGNIAAEALLCENKKNPMKNVIPTGNRNWAPHNLWLKSTVYCHHRQIRLVLKKPEQIPSIYSTIYKAAGSLVTGRFPKSCWAGQPLGAVPPLRASGMEQWNDGIVPVKSWNGWELWGWRLCE